jgi:hypothetical protein
VPAEIGDGDFRPGVVAHDVEEAVAALQRQPGSGHAATGQHRGCETGARRAADAEALGHRPERLHHAAGLRDGAAHGVDQPIRRQAQQPPRCQSGADAAAGRGDVPAAAVVADGQRIAQAALQLNAEDGGEQQCPAVHGPGRPRARLDQGEQCCGDGRGGMGDGCGVRIVEIEHVRARGVYPCGGLGAGFPVSAEQRGGARCAILRGVLRHEPDGGCVCASQA